MSTYENGNYIDAPFEKEKVKYWADFTITWFVSDDEDLEHSKWKEIEKTAFPLYVTHKEPIVGDNPNDGNDRPTQILHTTLNLACKNSVNESNIDDIVSSIYSEFTDQCVKRVNNKAEKIGNCLGYWFPPSTSGCNTVSEFLINGNARCNEWADFFNDMIKLQGIGQSKVTFIEYTENHKITTTMEMDLLLDIQTYFSNCIIQNIDISNTAIFVKNFSFTSDKFYVDEFKPTVTLCNGLDITNVNGTGVDIGIPAQGENNNDPQSVFYDHVIVQFNGLFYDPSYGTAPKNSKIDYEDNAFDGFGGLPFLRYINSNGQIKSAEFLYLYEGNSLNNLETIIKP